MSSAAPRTPPEEIGLRDDEPGAAADAVAWEMIEAGRYMPRRIRGSFRGRELG
jgi:hypothetical protein